jgi:release factor glutamine methyltransferase
MNGIVKYIVSRTYKPLLVKYLAQTRIYSYKGITLEIPPEVFHPGFFFSTKLLFRFLSYENLNHKSFLELGAGSGLLSIFAAKKGAHVTATDLNGTAIKTLTKNAATNKVKLNIVHSDLFEKIRKQGFDIIVINPPYYKKKPANESELAWYCGENGEYFESLFNGLRKYMHQQSQVLMVLCDGCDLEMIHGMASKHNFNMSCVYTRKNILENNYIFKIH